MKNLILAGLMICAFVIGGFAQTKNPALEAAMTKFQNAVLTKNSAVVLSYISRTKGLTIMNTIEQNSGNADNPVLDSKIKYAELAISFRRRGENYRNFFTVSDVAPSLFDNFKGSKGKWRLSEGDKFMPFEDGEMQKSLYVKWEKEGARWVVTEIGRMIS